MSEGTDTAGLAAAPAASAGTPEPRSARDVADGMFGGTAALVSTYGPAIQTAVLQLRDRTGMSAEEQTAHVAEMAHTFFDAQIPVDEASRIYSLVAHHAGAPPSAETLTEWSTEARRQLRQRYGDDADRRVAAAQAFIAARPELRARLSESGVGSHPDLVLALADRADALRITPRKRGGA